MSAADEGVTGEVGDEDRFTATMVWDRIGDGFPSMAAEHVIAEALAAERSRAEEKRAALVEALEGLAAKYSTRYSLMDERDKAVEARRFARSIRAVLDEHR